MQICIKLDIWAEFLHNLKNLKVNNLENIKVIYQYTNNSHNKLHYLKLYNNKFHQIL